MKLKSSLLILSSIICCDLSCRSLALEKAAVDFLSKGEKYDGAIGYCEKIDSEYVLCLETGESVSSKNKSFAKLFKNNPFGGKHLELSPIWRSIVSKEADLEFVIDSEIGYAVSQKLVGKSEKDASIAMLDKMKLISSDYFKSGILKGLEKHSAELSVEDKDKFASYRTEVDLDAKKLQEEYDLAVKLKSKLEGVDSFSDQDRVLLNELKVEYEKARQGYEVSENLEKIKKHATGLYEGKVNDYKKEISDFNEIIESRFPDSDLDLSFLKSVASADFEKFVISKYAQNIKSLLNIFIQKLIKIHDIKKDFEKLRGIKNSETLEKIRKSSDLEDNSYMNTFWNLTNVQSLTKILENTSSLSIDSAYDLLVKHSQVENATLAEKYAKKDLSMNEVLKETKEQIFERFKIYLNTKLISNSISKNIFEYSVNQYKSLLGKINSAIEKNKKEARKEKITEALSNIQKYLVMENENIVKSIENLSAAVNSVDISHRLNDSDLKSIENKSAYGKFANSSSSFGFSADNLGFNIYSKEGKKDLNIDKFLVEQSVSYLQAKNSTDSFEEEMHEIFSKMESLIGKEKGNDYLKGQNSSLNMLSKSPEELEQNLKDGMSSIKQKHIDEISKLSK
ncbi:hypothetical protein [Candidatus Nesciobacter abundans]|uniref:Uncharacterized protein n=1 Tax=Candidatus Nesciobacter abundans TaxID=2601668 RepID=A0A5C0UI24_9PROT|nr:hypothetical protein [Candidatus Nesciobacter abundans]QEK39032.1 hypothetical protein FZC36_01105 [Candidatus Nesciobacter abundans]